LTVASKRRAVRSDAGATERARRDSAGLLLGRLTVLPALVFLSFLLTSFPLLLIGYFKPVPVIAAWLALTAAIVPYAWRRIPSVTGAGWGTAGAGEGASEGASTATPTPRWTLWSLAAIAVAFGVFQAVYHSQFVIVQLDAASYLQFANWISAHGSLPIPQDAAAFGHAPGVAYASGLAGGSGFYQVGSSIVPQFMAGLPMLLSLGFWAGGFRVALFAAPVLGALGIFTFGGLVARLVGPRWAPFAALALGIGIPEAYVSRDTYSETLAQVLFLGALSLWTDAQRTDRGAEDAGPWRTRARSASQVLAGLTGLLFGMTLLVRVDGPADILLIIPYCGLLVLRRQRQAVPLIAGLLVSIAYGAQDAWHLTRPYLETNKTSVIPLAGLIVAMIVAVTAAVWWLRRRGSELRNPPQWWLVRVVTMLPFVMVAAFVVRPYVERNWRALQDAQFSLHWVYWYTGAAAIAFAVIAFAILGRRCVKGEAPLWVLPLVTFAWCITYFLLRPAITPHQPYASRRLVPAVLPGVILLAVWLASWLAHRSRAFRLPARLERLPARLEDLPRVLVIACCAGAIFLPPLIGNFGLGLKSGGPLGLMPASDGLALQRSYVGEIAAVDKICAAIPANSSVLIDDYTMNQQFGEAIRGTCGVPVAGVQTVVPFATRAPGNHIALATALADVRAVERAGRHPVVLAPTRSELAPLGQGVVKFVLDEETSIDEHVTFGTPRNTIPQRFTAYSWQPAR
jgi:hypothetical protein